MYYNLGNVYKALNNNELAEENFSKGHRGGSILRPSYINLGTVLEGQEVGDAIRVTRRAVGRNRHSRGFTSTSGSRRAHGKLKEAREEYDAAKGQAGLDRRLGNLGWPSRTGQSTARRGRDCGRRRVEPKNAWGPNNLGVVMAAMVARGSLRREPQSTWSIRARQAAEPRVAAGAGRQRPRRSSSGRLCPSSDRTSTRACGPRRTLGARRSGTTDVHDRLAAEPCCPTRRKAWPSRRAHGERRGVRARLGAGRAGGATTTSHRPWSLLKEGGEIARGAGGGGALLRRSGRPQGADPGVTSTHGRGISARSRDLDRGPRVFPDDMQQAAAGELYRELGAEGAIETIEGLIKTRSRAWTRGHGGAFLGDGGRREGDRQYERIPRRPREETVASASSRSHDPDGRGEDRGPDADDRGMEPEEDAAPSSTWEGLEPCSR